MIKIFGRVIQSDNEFNENKKVIDQMTINQVKADKEIRDVKTELSALRDAHNTCVAQAGEAFTIVGRKQKSFNIQLTLTIAAVAVLAIVTMLLSRDNVFE